MDTIRAITQDNNGKLVLLTQAVDTTNQQIADLQAAVTAFQVAVNQKLGDLQAQLLQLQASLG